MKEHKIGEVFTHNGVKLRVEEDVTIDCQGCVGEGCNITCVSLPSCYSDFRKDNKSVIFKLVEDDNKQI